MLVPLVNAIVRLNCSFDFNSFPETPFVPLFLSFVAGETMRRTQRYTQTKNRGCFYHGFLFFSFSSKFRRESDLRISSLISPPLSLSRVGGAKREGETRRPFSSSSSDCFFNSLVRSTRGFDREIERENPGNLTRKHSKGRRRSKWGGGGSCTGGQRMGLEVVKSREVDIDERYEYNEKPDHAGSLQCRL